MVFCQNSCQFSAKSHVRLLLFTFRFKTPEGRYCLVAERTSGLVPFSYQKSTRLTLAHLSGGGPEDGLWCLYNVGDYLHIARYDATHKASSWWP
jgi:hypothetical protein